MRCLNNCVPAAQMLGLVQALLVSIHSIVNETDVMQPAVAPFRRCSQPFNSHQSSNAATPTVPTVFLRGQWLNDRQWLAHKPSHLQRPQTLR
jgi:hypothetical protein